MASGSKRDTVLPRVLWGQGSDPQPQQKASQEALHSGSTRFGVPIKSKVSVSTTLPKSVKDIYHKTYNVDQAGIGVIVVKDVKQFPVFLLKTKELRGQAVQSSKLKHLPHENLINLVDSFHSDQHVHLIYEYEHLAISLGCVANIVDFTEADIATICKELLVGLRYIHLELRICHGRVNCSNILITHDGKVKLGTVLFH